MACMVAVVIAEPSAKVNVANDGASYSWEGDVVHSGEMAIVGGEENRRIGCRLTFLTPWKSMSSVEFTFAEKEAGVETTWPMEGSGKRSCRENLLSGQIGNEERSTAKGPCRYSVSASERALSMQFGQML